MTRDTAEDVICTEDKDAKRTKCLGESIAESRKCKGPVVGMCLRLVWLQNTESEGDTHRNDGLGARSKGDGILPYCSSQHLAIYSVLAE